MSARIRILIASLREVIGIVVQESTSFVKVRLAIVLLLVLAVAAMAPLGPLALKLMIDRFTSGALWTIPSILALLGLYVLSQWLSRCIGEIRGVVYGRANRRMLRTISERLFSHVMHLPMKFHVGRQTGAICQAVDNGLQGYQMVLNYIIFTFLPVLAQLGMIAVILLRFNQPVFLLLFGIGIVCYVAAFGFFAARVNAIAKNASHSQIDATAIMTDSIMNYETVKFFAAESVVQERVGRAFTNTENAWVGFQMRSAINGVGAASIFAAFLFSAVFWAAYEVKTGHMSVGDFVLVNAYVLQIISPLESLGYAFQGMSQGIGLLENMLALLRERSEVAESNRFPVHIAGKLEFDRVSLAYRAERSVLQDICFRLEAGRTLGIVGASGAGKSTLVRLLTRLYEPDGGRILLDGEVISELSLKKLRRAIAVVPQDTVLFNDTIGFNIGFGKPGCTQAEIELAAQAARLHDLIMSLPEKYDTVVGERGVRLSGGEKQRVSIARAAIKGAKVYVFDEATSSLDSQTEKEIIRNIAEMSRSCTTLIIAHRLSTVLHADEILVLDNGAVVERGDHESLLRLGGRYHDLWRAQQQSAVAA